MIKKLLFIAIIVFYSTISFGSSYKWELGGKTLYQSDNGIDTNIPLQLGVSGGITGFNACSKFSPKASVKLMFDELENALITLNNIPSAILSSLPGYIVCRAKPGLCQLLQDYTARLEAQYKLHIKSCEDVIKAATNRENPYSDWITVSQAQQWRDGDASKKSTLTMYKDIVAKRDNGVIWINGERAGGKNQKQIQPLRHTSAAGWCIVQGKSPACKEGDPRSIYTRSWQTPEAFKAWVASVLGDIGLWVYQGAPPPQSVSGYGLEPIVQQYETDIALKLKQVLGKSKSNVTQDDLDALSTRDSKMTIKLLEALENHNERLWLESNLVSRIALGKTIDKALLTMKVLYSGRQDPIVRDLSPARDFVDEALERLEKEIDLLLYDVKTRNQLLGDFGKYVLSKHLIKFPKTKPMPFQYDAQ